MVSDEVDVFVVFVFEAFGSEICSRSLWYENSLKVEVSSSTKLKWWGSSVFELSIFEASLMFWTLISSWLEFSKELIVKLLLLFFYLKKAKRQKYQYL